MRAFLGDQSVKARLVAQLDHDLHRGCILRQRTGWRDGAGSFAASLGRSGDLYLVQTSTGIPLDVLAVADHLCGGSNLEDEVVPTFARDLLDSIAPGAQLEGVGVQFATWMLVDGEKGMVAKCAYNQPLLVLAQIYAAGQAPSRADWAQAATDYGPRYQVIAGMLRAGAKSSNGAEALCALLSGWLDVWSDREVNAKGWTNGDEVRAQEVLQRLWDETVEQREHGPWPDFPRLFASVDPVLAAAYAAALETANRTVNEFALDASRKLRSLAAAMPGGAVGDATP